MNKRNKKKFKKTHDLIKKEKDAVDETLKLKRKSVRKEMEDIRQFEKMSNRYGFACDAYSDITDEN